MPRRTDPIAGQRGFTLIEVLIALAIAALALGALLANASFGLGGVITASRHIQATRQAESLLAEASSATYLAAGERSGTNPDGSFWHVSITERGRIDQTVLAAGAGPPGTPEQNPSQGTADQGTADLGTAQWAALSAAPPGPGQAPPPVGAVDAGPPNAGAAGPAPPGGAANPLKPGLPSRSGIGLFAISATVGWRNATGARQVTLDSLRIAPLPATEP